ncbi:MAG: sodium:solute symporter, partial [Clostridia bacterium]|nr:sodium:solute symporter [Clostridia bacterium]
YRGQVVLAGGTQMLAVAAVLKTNGGFVSSLNALAEVSDETVSTAPGVFNSFFGPDPLGLLSVIILTSLGTWGLPQMVQKFYSIKDEGSIKKGTIISTLFAIVVAGGCYFLGGFGRLFTTSADVAEKGYDSIIPTMLSNLSPLLIGIIIILVLSASMSTLSALVMASSSTLTLDFISGVFVKDMNEKRKLLFIRLLIVVFILISVIIAIFQYKSGVTFIAQLMGISWGALAGSFLAPFLLSLYWKRTTKAAVFASFAFGSCVMIANMLFRTSFPALLQSPINCGAMAMLAGFIIVPVVSAFTKAPDAKLVGDAFACYDKQVVVPVSQSLAD